MSCKKNYCRVNWLVCSITMKFAVMHFIFVLLLLRWMVENLYLRWWCRFIHWILPFRLGFYVYQLKISQWMAMNSILAEFSWINPQRRELQHRSGDHSCGSGGRVGHLPIGGLLPGSFSLQLEASLDKILNSELPLMHPSKCQCVCENVRQGA